MAPKQSSTPGLRSKAVKVALGQGLSLAEAARRLAIPKGTLRTWANHAKGGQERAATKRSGKRKSGTR